jgi:hypothetical protein
MKIRKGFISNSSSSSFVVEVEKWDWKEKTLTRVLSRELEDFLQENGFIPSSEGYPARVEHSYFDGEKLPKPNFHSHFLVCKVTCNEEEVIELLVEHGISFRAHTQYGTESLWYKCGWDHVLVVPNPGIHMLIYGESVLGTLAEKEGPVKESILNWTQKKVLLDCFLTPAGPPTRFEWELEQIERWKNTIP